ncbi:MAG TPA: DNA methyltransferase [Micromonosporaceae bacterium]
MRSGEEIQRALRDFVTRWEGYAGSERGEAQTFLNELFACFGGDRRTLGAIFEDAHTSAGIMDLHLPGVVIVEMKAPSQAGRLAAHRRQAFDYWHNSADVATDRAAPQYVVLCAFHEFEVWEPGRFPNAPRATFTLKQLPDRYETLLFLAGPEEEPLFGAVNRELTTEAAFAMAKVYHDLLDRQAAAPEAIQRFVLQMVWLFFAEDYGMVGGKPVEHILELLAKQSLWTSYMMFGGLFMSLNDPDDHGRHGVLRGTRYVNGELFARPALVHINQDEARAFLDLARYDWRAVDPTIFGSLMEGFLGQGRRALGAHYTHEVDIMKIVRPTIVRPWRERIEATSTPEAARRLLEELCRFRVLDPACGCGNFLYIAYRELRSLEAALKQRIQELSRQTGLPVPDGPLPYYPLSNLHGIDVEPVVTQIARVTLWMGHRQMVDQFGEAEAPLPLVDLSTIRAVDALAVPWPEVDCVIGNPPFLGSQSIREAHGDDYVRWLKETYKIGVKDYCVYWFRRAHDHLKPGQRAGLVGTNSISQNRARSASLEYVVGNGGVITDAVSTQKWPGDAKVHVSLVNWTKQPDPPPAEFRLDGVRVPGITAELRTPAASTGIVAALGGNKGRCFQGPIPVGDGFIISADEAASLLARTDANYREVVRPYLVGDDITEDQPNAHDAGSSTSPSFPWKPPCDTRQR